MTRALIDPRLTTRIGKTHLGRDTGLELYRATTTIDTEGNSVGTTNHLCTFVASIGEPNVRDVQIAQARGSSIDAKMVFDPNQKVTDLTSGFPQPQITLNVQVGDQVWGRGRKWVIVDVFKEIVVTCHLQSFGADNNE